MATQTQLALKSYTSSHLDLAQCNNNLVHLQAIFWKENKHFMTFSNNCSKNILCSYKINTASRTCHWLD